MTSTFTYLRIRVILVLLLMTGYGCGVTKKIDKVPVVHASTDRVNAYLNEFANTEERRIRSWQSPDHEWDVLVERGPTLGFQAVYVSHMRTGKKTLLFTLWDNDVGSGHNMSCRWSKDSKSLQLRGLTLGFGYSDRERTQFSFIYMVDEKKLYGSSKTVPD